LIERNDTGKTTKISGKNMKNLLPNARANSWRSLFRKLLAGGCLAALASTAHATSGYWKLNGSGPWATTGNWAANADGSGTISTVPGAGDTATFNYTAFNNNVTATLAADLSLGSFVFNNTGTTAINTDGTANRTNTLSGGITMNSGAGAVTFGTNTTNKKIYISLGSSQTWLNNSSSLLSFPTQANPPNMHLNANQLTIDGSGSFNVQPYIDGTGGSIVKTGSGTLTLGGQNFFTGGLTIKAGTVQLANSSTSGGAGVIKLGDTTGSAAATLQILNSSSVMGTPANALTVQSGSSGTKTIGNAANAAAPAFGGAITMNDNLTANAGSGSLTFSSAATINLNANTLSTITVSGSQIAFNGAISGTGNFTVSSGAGTVTLTGANSYSGITTVSAGTLNTTTASTGAGSYSVADGATLGVSIASAGQTLNMSSLTLGSSAGATLSLALQANNPTAPVITDAGALTLNGTVTVNVGVAGGGTLTGGTFVLLSYSSLSGSGSFTAGKLIVPGYTATLTHDTVSKQLKLTLTPVAQPSQNLVSYWPMDTLTTTTPDTAPAGNNNNLTASNSPTVGSGGVFANAISFNNASTNYLDLTYTATNGVNANGLPIFNSPNGYTVAFWVKAAAGASGNSGAFIYGEANTTTTAPFFGLRVDSVASTQKYLNVSYRNDSSVLPVNANSTTQVFDGTWHHVAWVDDKLGHGTLYIDGVADATSFNYTPSGTCTLNNTSVGAEVTTTIKYPFTGSVDDLIVWNRPLSASEINQIKNSSLPVGTTYVWTQTAGGAQNWAATANWGCACIPSPVSGDTVDFSTVNIAADTTLTLGADRTAATWKFGDTSGSQTWTVNSGNKMILAGTTPTINNGVQTTLNCVVDGTAGLTKTGSGLLYLTGANTYSGATTVSGGTLNTTTASTGAGSYSVTNGATLGVSIASAGQTLNMSSLTLGTAGATTLNITLQSGNPTATVITDAGALTLNGTVTVNVSGGASLTGSTVVLLSYSSLGGSGSFTAGTLPTVAGYYTSLSNDTAAKQLKLVFQPTGGGTPSNVWDGGGADDTWANPNNWVGDGAPVFPTNLIFAGSTRLTPYNEAVGRTVNGITFDAAAGPFVLGGNAIALNGDIGFSATPANPVTQTINLGMSFSWYHSLTVPTNCTVVLGGQLYDVWYSCGLSKSGPGTLVLNGTCMTNRYGTISVNEGQLIVKGTVATHLNVDSGATVGGNGYIDDLTLYGSAMLSTTNVLHLNYFNPTGGNVVHLTLSNSTPAGTYTLATFGYTYANSLSRTPVIDSGSIISNALPVITTMVNADGSGTVVLEVVPIVTTTTTLGSSLASAPYGQTVHLTATVTPAGGWKVPTGTVQFFVDGQPFGFATPVGMTGVAGISTDALPLGPHTVTAQYTSDQPYFISSSGSLAGGQQVQWPTLGMTAQPPNSRILAWPAAAMNYRLQSATDLGTPAVWAFSTNATTISGGNTLSTNTGNSARAFFRLANAVPLGMARIPAGTFVMGNTFSGEGNTDELPLHSVFVSEFYMDRFEVTKAQWDSVAVWAVTNGYTFDNSGATGLNSSYPVRWVNWWDCVKWCNARSEMEGRVPAYYTNAAQTAVYRTGQLDLNASWVKWTAGYRLPTEAEWEKAARGGAAGHRYPWSDTDAIDYSRANYAGQTVNSHSSPPGFFAPNGYGLYDLAGNVYEWCWDWYGPYGSASQTDPRGPASGSDRVIRGGSFFGDASSVRNAWRGYATPDTAALGEPGFRCVLPPSP
jgi:autotransporter-associated beta strand protein